MKENTTMKRLLLIALGLAMLLTAASCAGKKQEPTPPRESEASTEASAEEPLQPLPVTELSVGTTVMAVDLSLSVSAIDLIPEAPAYTDVLSLTESQMDAIGEALMSHPLFSQLFSN